MTDVSRRVFLERLTIVFGAVTLAPGLSVLEIAPVRRSYVHVGALFDVLREESWLRLGNLTHLEPPSMMRTSPEIFEDDIVIHPLKRAPLHMLVDDVPLLVNVLGSVWMGHVTEEHEAPPETTLYRVVFGNGGAFFFPASMRRED